MSVVGFARRGFLAAAGVVVSGLVLSHLFTALSQAQDRVNLTLVSYAVTRAAYNNIIPKFAAQWEAETGQRVFVETSYAGSATQSRAVIDGLDADVAALALALDIHRIQDAGLIQPGWEERTPNRGILTRSVTVIVTREGNPKGIQDWDDLAKEGINVVTANPKTSGGARWNFLSLWGYKTLVQEATDDEALEFTTQVYQNVGVLPRDAREATDVFFQKGQGDALITYEHEVLLANLRGENLPYILPSSSISIDNPVAVVDEIVDRKGTREVAEAFVAFLFTPEAQREFAKVGFRPVNPEVAAEFADQYPVMDNLFTVEDLGGWDAIQERFFDDGAIFDNIQAQL
ncbi:sulfate ABC transporter substrate-binding protein [Thermostichus vulcanus]|uniref:Sulfate ABC transporter substrate-binding protein n=1 Tax=Thermostichus vulcanus str. 'Rupite' TaxID=2813851 RepID=A0ABT0CB28_THEVL|nr:sulfate ABC transporter substrate-binding protein [Thermostichus vulcanus]MCJ2542988.1 sulfate ABC transporter substrate-binding protein [Thermostichus vulcanus str. 'Rupite']